MGSNPAPFSDIGKRAKGTYLCLGWYMEIKKKKIFFLKRKLAY